VRLGTRILSVLASLVLGLLIATAQTSFDTTEAEIRRYGADLILLAETFRDYGDTAMAPAAVLRTYTQLLLADKWPTDGDHKYIIEDAEAGGCWSTCASRSVC
jgi:hypothetical protein